MTAPVARCTRVRLILTEERGSGSAMALSIAVVLVALTALILPVSTALGSKAQLAADADAAALAAADIASGAVAGYPCDGAAEAARLGGSELVDCRVDGLISTVTVARVIWGIGVSVTVRAGPPPDGSPADVPP